MTLTAAYLGPAGTHTEEALLASAAVSVQREPCATLHDTVMAVQSGKVDRAVVPIENSIEGGVAATLDALAGEAGDVRIVAEVVHPIHHHLVARPGLALEDVATVVSMPHATAQCARFLDAKLPRAERMAATSTAEAVRIAGRSDGAVAALGSRLAAELYGCRMLAEAVEDRDDNVTRFVWLAREGDAREPAAGTPAKTSVVFWGFNDSSPGALVSVLGELSQRGINLTRIESRPQRVRLGHYMFFADLDGRAGDDHVAEALGALSDRVHTLRMLGSYPAWADRVPR
ncbi:MAG: prephenate dehydratase [Thermoleophilaceae bacterium]